MITVHTITYNEEIMIEFFINHYRNNFPKCKINIYDNYSTDKTVEIAKKHNCNVIFYDTNNQLNDQRYLEIKNNCWKDSETDWVVVCDCDELIEINQNQLTHEESNGTNIIKSTGFCFMNNNPTELCDMKYGFRDLRSDKCVLFNKKHLSEINYGAGAHVCSPIPNNQLTYNKDEYRLLHYKYLNPEYTINRYEMFSKRLSDVNKKNKWGFHYNMSKKDINDFYINKQKELIKLL